VEVEICGSEYDNAKVKTKTVGDNGFNPVWDECFDFTVKNPDLAMIRFVGRLLPQASVFCGLKFFLFFD
jgi:hypothetical protein